MFKLIEELATDRELTKVVVDKCTSDVIDKFVARLWAKNTIPTVFVVSPNTWKAIWNGLEPGDRTLAKADGRCSLNKLLLAEGWTAFPYFSGNIFMDKFMSDHDMYAFCAANLTAKHNGRLTWKTFVPNKNSEQSLEERLVAIETVVGLRQGAH